MRERPRIDPSGEEAVEAEIEDPWCEACEGFHSVTGETPPSFHAV